MLRSVNFPPLEALGSANPATSFLMLLWQEMFDENTPDTFRPRLQNIPALIMELHEVAGFAREAPIWEKHIHELKDELRAAIRENDGLLASVPRYRWELDDLLTFSGAVQVEREARHLIDAAPSDEEFYRGNLIRMLAEMPQNKSGLILATNNLASFAARKGWRREDLFNLASEGLFPATPHALVDRLCAPYMAVEENYRYVAALSGSENDIRAVLRRYSNISIVSVGERDMSPQSADFFGRNYNCTFVRGNIEARGVVDAAKKALRQVRPLADLLNFFNNASTLAVREEVLVASDGGAIEFVNIENQSLQRLRPRKIARALTASALDRLGSSRLRGRLLNALELHSLAHGAAAPRVRMVNLWSAIECLLGSRKNESLIEHAASLIAPLVAWNRVEKIVRYLAISLHQFRSYGTSIPHGVGFENSTAHSVESADLLAVLVKPRGHISPAALAAYTLQHPLLKYRLFRAWEGLSEPALLRKELEASQQRIRWQLFRIYRARNLSVHQGVEVEMSNTLLDTLQYYFSFLLSRIVAQLKRNGSWELDDAIASLSREARYRQETLRGASSRLQVRDLIPEAKFRAEELLWLPAPIADSASSVTPASNVTPSA